MYKQKVIRLKDFAKLERALADGYLINHMLTSSMVVLQKWIKNT